MGNRVVSGELVPAVIKPGGGTITVTLPNQAYPVAENEKGWIPIGDKKSKLTSQ